MAHMPSVAYGYARLEFEVIAAGTYIIEAGRNASGTPGTCTLVVTSNNCRRSSSPTPRRQRHNCGRRLHHQRPLVLAPRDMDGTAVYARAAGVWYLAKAFHMRQRRGAHLLDLLTSGTVLNEVANHVRHLLHAIHPASHMTSLAKSVPKAGYGTSDIEYVLPTIGR